MGSRVLLDTNAVVFLAKGQDDVLRAVARFDVRFVSVFSMGELFAGAARSSRPVANREAIAAYLQFMELVTPTLDTAYIFGGLVDQMKRKGRAASQNDLWIAATAIELGIPVATMDQDFDAIDGLSVVRW